MFNDLKKYTKFYAIDKSLKKSDWAVNEFSKLLKKCKVKTKQMTIH